MSDLALISNQAQSFLEIVKVGKIDISTLTLVTSNPGAGNFQYGEVIFSQAHGLPFTPLILGYEDESFPPDSVSLYMPNYSDFGVPSNTGQWIIDEMYCDSTNVYFKAVGLSFNAGVNFGSSGSIFAHYYLLRERTN